jgi:MFS family permease
MAAAMADYLGPRRAAVGLSVITLFFAAGQVFGPATAGMISDATGSFSLSYALAAVLTLTAIILAALLRRPAILPD